MRGASLYLSLLNLLVTIEHASCGDAAVRRCSLAVSVAIFATSSTAVLKLGSGRYFSPHHEIQFQSRSEGLNIF
jgi:hypothetical protein